MRILFLDTETNGLPQNRHAPYTMATAWPALVQVAWQVVDFSVPASPVPVYTSSFLVQPEAGQVWNQESAAIHGFTEAAAKTEGVPAVAVLRSLINDAVECDIVVAHNLGFDKPVLLAATVRAGLNPRWWPKHEICTMLATIQVCKIPSTSKWAAKDPYKWPKLAEVWQTLFPTSALPTNLHDARQDVAVLVTCFQELVARDLLVLPVVPRRDRFTDFFRRVWEVLGA